MELAVIGKPYAKAIAAIATNEQSLDRWKQLLYALSLITEDLVTRDFISAPATTNEQKVSFLLATLEAALGTSLGEKEVNFINLLVANNKILAAHGILVSFQSLHIAHEKSITVQSAYPLSKAELDDIRTQLSKTYNTDISLTTQVDRSLYAGVIIKDGDKVIDLSITTRAGALAARLLI